MSLKKRILKGCKIFIDVEFEDAELNAKEAMEEFIEDCELKLCGEFYPVTRGKGTAIAAHIKGAEGYSDYYEKRYFHTDIQGKDVVGKMETIDETDNRLVLAPKFTCWDEGVKVGVVLPETIAQLPKSG